MHILFLDIFLKFTVRRHEFMNLNKKQQQQKTLILNGNIVIFRLKAIFGISEGTCLTPLIIFSELNSCLKGEYSWTFP